MAEPSSPICFADFIREALPHVFSIKTASEKLPGVIAAGTIRNALSAKVGPPHEMVNGRVVLERNSFIEWLMARSRKAQGVR